MALALLENKVLGNIQDDLMLESRKKIVDTWDAAGMLENLNGVIKENVAISFENTAKMLLESTGSAGSNGSFETVIFPLLRRVFSKLLLNDIATVQAMNMPYGKIFYFIPKTSARVQDGNVYDHTSLAAKNLPSCVVGVGCKATAWMEKNLYDLFYDNGLFDQSRGAITINVLTASAPLVLLNGTWTGATSPYARNSADNGVRDIIIKVSGFSSTGKGRFIGPDGNEMDSESFLASLKVITNSGTTITGSNASTLFVPGEEVPFTLATQKYGKGIVSYDSNNICDGLGDVYIKLDFTKPASAAGQSADGLVGAASGSTFSSSSFVVSYASYASLEFETEINEVSFDLTSTYIEVGERKLRANWSLELATDVKRFQNIDVEAELTGLMSEQVAAEIDREGLIMLSKAAPWVAQWDYSGWRKITTTSTSYIQKEWNQELFTAISQISNQIHKATLKGGANFIVVSTDVHSVFQTVEYFHTNDTASDDDTYAMGIAKAGTLNGQIKVYVDPYLPQGTVIIGHKGGSIFDTGFVYCPYVPIQLSQLMWNSMNGQPVKYLMTRYAMKVVNNRYYGKVRVFGTKTFPMNELY